MTRWFKAPNTTGLWWYWLLGSSVVRHQDVLRSYGLLPWTKNIKGKLCVVTDGLREASKTARLWCRSTTRPKLPPMKLRKWLEHKHCGNCKR